MRVVNIVCLLLLGYPAMAAGYLWGAIRSGFLTGAFFYDRHEGENVSGFVTERKPARGAGTVLNRGKERYDQRHSGTFDLGLRCLHRSGRRPIL
jgi:hypothetical protein